jgi:hypothetical protein
MSKSHENQQKRQKTFNEINKKLNKIQELVSWFPPLIERLAWSSRIGSSFFCNFPA